MVELTALPIAVFLLSKFGLPAIGIEHAKLILALLGATAILFLPVFLFKVFSVPAAMDTEAMQEIDRLRPKLSPIVIERRKSLKAKYDQMGPDGQAVLRQIAIDGSIIAPMLSSKMPAFWYTIKEDGFVEDASVGRLVLSSKIYDDVFVVIEEDIKSRPTIPTAPKHDP